MAAIREALAAAGGNRAEAARSLQVDYKTLYLKLKKYRMPIAKVFQHGRIATEVDSKER